MIGSNNFAASLALGAMGERQRRIRIAAVFGVFEFLIPLIGLWLGRQAANVLAGVFELLGPLLLAAIGAASIYSGDRGHVDDSLGRAMTSWRGLVALAATLSLDNLVVGFALGIRESPLKLAAYIASFAILFTFVGLHLGDAAKRKRESYAKFASGFLLILLAVALWLGWI
ncbi:MAG: manganese efflux pump MntP family protein [Bryobacteraceae bacterium]